MAQAKYDAKTANGIPYVSRLYSGSFRYSCLVDDLDALCHARRAVLSGSGNVTQYSIGSRQLTRAAMNATQTLALWDKLMAEKEQMEGAGSPRKCVGIVLEDW
jgi:hypothetical protein